MQDVMLSSLRLSYELLLVWFVWTTWISWSDSDRLSARGLVSGQPQQRHAHSPRDCSVCRAAHGAGEGHEQQVVEPWLAHKSKRGRPKLVATEGYCCPNPRCPYYQITDARVHALVGAG